MKQTRWQLMKRVYQGDEGEDFTLICTHRGAIGLMSTKERKEMTEDVEYATFALEK